MLYGDLLTQYKHRVPFNEVNTIYITGAMSAEVSRSVCPPDTCPWGWVWGPILCAQGLLHEPRDVSLSPTQVTWGYACSSPILNLCRCLYLGHLLSLLDSLTTRLSFYPDSA